MRGNQKQPLNSTASDYVRGRIQRVIQFGQGALNTLMLVSFSVFGAGCATSPAAIWDSIFTSQQSPEERAEEQALLQQDRAIAQQMTVRRALRTGDVTLGMTRDEVHSVWGEPRGREIAGETRQGNERWVYTTGVSSAWSLAPKKFVYFERGRVVGWESER